MTKETTKWQTADGTTIFIRCHHYPGYNFQEDRWQVWERFPKTRTQKKLTEWLHGNKEMAIRYAKMKVRGINERAA